MYAFDAYGFFTGTVEKSDSNSTEIQPPECESGKLPRFANGAWVCEVKDFAAIIASEQAQIAASLAAQQKAAILARLAEIDALGDTPRARREALIGAVTWLEKLNAEAATLRAELEKLT